MTKLPGNPERFSQRHWWWLCVAATIGAVILHGLNLACAGALWRDEANGALFLNHASAPEVWRMLEHFSCPAFFPFLFRAWLAVVPGDGDFGLRIFGCLVGLAGLGSLWLNARLVNGPLPLLSLVLFALNPVVIRWGDSLRAYGCGVLFILLTFGLVWSFVCQPSPRRFVLASLAGVLSVQCLYQNAFLLFAICASASLIWVRRRRLDRAGWALALGVPAAVSLLPYLSVIHASQRWFVVAKTGFRPVVVGGSVWDALNSPPVLGPLLWLVLFGATAVLAFQSFETRVVRQSAIETDLPVFGALTALSGVLIFFVFIAVAGLPTQPWYWLTLMGLLAVSFETAFARQLQSPPRWFLLALISMLCLSVTFAIAPITRRMTNVDGIAAKVKELAQPADLVLVCPWYCGVSFERYYHGPATWDTVPELAEHSFHRYDLLKEKLSSPQPLQSIHERMKQTLLAGNSVWIVGSLPPAPLDGAVPPALPPAPDGPQGWFDEPYNATWGAQIAYWLQMHVQNAEVVPLEGTTRVQRYERLSLLRARGFRGGVFTQPP